MTMEWKEVLLGELVEIKHGFAFKGEYFSEEKTNDILLTPGNFAIGGGFQWGKLKFYDGPIPSDYILTEGDLVVTMTDLSKAGDTLGYSAIVPSSQKLLLHNQRIGKIKTKTSSVDEMYLSYQLRTKSYRNEVLASATGSTVKHTSPTKICAYRFLLPPLDEQKAIASVLSALDDKIENNRRMNETLEEMARAIFKSWFVDFDPVHAKAAGNAPAHMDAETAALFPNSFGDDGLPVGWANKALGDIILPKRGKTITKSKTKEGTIPVVAGGLEPAYFHNQSNVEAPVVTISASGANAGFTRLYNENIWASDCSHISKQLTDTIYFWYVFLKINQQKIYHMQQGAAQPHIYPSDLIRLELTVPNDNKLIQHFENLISPYFQKISIAQKESKTLAELRDTLLPKLMSGEIRVADAEREVEAVV